ncbi:peptidoglycan recognition protein family protein [Aliikangiella sp. IMCC44359]|uniref:peptidoglycan recognition protein family protein n=1 Tax=Aliikangiella sp. IMCC44359 TaxID=3459125 RepID=UPI00403AE865
MKTISNSKRRFLKLAAVSTGLSIAGGIYWPSRWQYIVIHHSAGNFGNIDFLQKVHRQRQSDDPIDAIPYHFIIGNGNGMKVGEVATDWRGENNLWGAHVSGRNSKRNFLGLGICLIGDYENNQVPELQYQSLLKLVSSLMERFNIAVDNVSGHGHIKNEFTLCPGKNFPMDRLKKDLKRYQQL